MSSLPSKVRKVAETQGVLDVSRSTSVRLSDSLEREGAERVRKVPLCLDPREEEDLEEEPTPTLPLDLEVPAVEGKDHPTVCRRMKYDLELKDVLPARLRKTGRGAAFIPLSMGRGLQVLWWRPVKVELAPGTDRWMLMTVHPLFNCCKETLSPNMNDSLVLQFKCDFEDVLLISYLNYSLVELMDRGRWVQEYEEWKKEFEDTTGKDPRIVAIEVFERCFLKPRLKKIGSRFNFFFCKKMATTLEVPDGMFYEKNVMSITREIPDKNFRYEFQAALYYTRTPYTFSS